MKHPATVHGREVTKIKLVFTTQFDILSVLKKILGEDKIMASIQVFCTFVMLKQSHNKYTGCQKFM